MKVPYVVVLGDKEVESGNYTVELRDGSKIELTQDALLEKLATEIKERI
jgi:threonyl-tRNA synthetase